MKRRLLPFKLALKAEPIDYGAKLHLSRDANHSLTGQIYYSKKKGKFSSYISPGQDEELTRLLQYELDKFTPEKKSLSTRLPLTSEAPVSGIPAIDAYITNHLPALHSAGLFPEEMKPLAYGLKLRFSDSEGIADVTIYYSKKKGLSFVSGKSKNKKLMERVTSILIPSEKALPSQEKALSVWIGTDEAGKGDYFGPLVVAAVLLDKDLAKRATKLGAVDSKRLKNPALLTLAGKLRTALAGRFSVVEIGPERYNQLYQSFSTRGRRLNDLLAWAHGRAVRDLVERKLTFDAVVVDKFARVPLIQKYMPSGINLIARTKAEDNPAVAAASILARAAYLMHLEKLSKQYDEKITPGAGPVVDRTGKRLVARHGEDILSKTAKVHFVTTKKILGIRPTPNKGS